MPDPAESSPPIARIGRRHHRGSTQKQLGRVVLFTTGHWEIGGCASHSRKLAEGLASRGWSVLAIGRAGTATRFRIARHPGMTFVDVPGFGSRVGAPLYLLVAIPLGLLRGRGALLLAFQLGAQALAAGFVSAVLRRPVVAFSTTSGPSGEIQAMLKSRMRAPHRAVLRRARWLVGQTPSAARELSHLTTPDRVTVLPTPAIRCEASALTGHPRALFTGRLTAQKNLPVLLDAWTRIVVDRPSSELTLAGEGGAYGPEEELLRAIVSERRELRDSVRFMGWVEDVAPLLERADVFAFPSLWEGMSNSLLEACAHGRVIVASDIPENRDVLGDDHPLLFEPGDSESLAVQLLRAFDDDDVREEARRRALARARLFSLDAVLDDLEDLLRAADRSRH